MADWIGVIGVVAGVVVGAGIQEFRLWMERKQRYQVMTFDKCLEAHQRAFYWCQKLNEILNIGQTQEIHEIAVNARDWWNSNSLLLDENSRKSMLFTMNLAHSFAREMSSPIKQDVRIGDQVWSSLDKSFKAIMEGIGTEYLPEIKSVDKTDKA